MVASTLYCSDVDGMYASDNCVTELDGEVVGAVAVDCGLVFGRGDYRNEGVGVAYVFGSAWQEVGSCRCRGAIFPLPEDSKSCF